MFSTLRVRFLVIGGLLAAPHCFAQDGSAVEKESDGKQQHKGKVEALTIKQGARGESKGKGDGKKTRRGGQQAGPQERPGKGKAQPAK
ncbi:MAG: hypothetical protein ACK5AZ_17690 [Bryobacteraceae bacterium]